MSRCLLSDEDLGWWDVADDVEPDRPYARSARLQVGERAVAHPQRRQVDASHAQDIWKAVGSVGSVDDVEAER